MSFDKEVLFRIFKKNEGYCYHCGKKLAFDKYGDTHSKGGWEVDHSVPVSKGGTGHLNNLLPSCIPCNRTKGDLTTRQYRKTLEQDSEETENPLEWIIALGLIIGIGWLLTRRK